MAVLSVQLVFSMITASLLSKLSPDFSFARWILCSRLVRYMHPSDEELKTLAGIGNNKGPGRKNRYVKPKEETFTVPKNIELQLDATPIKKVDVIPLHFYTEYQWMLDFAMCSLMVYCLTELYYALFTPNEFNLSMMWCLLVLGFSMKILLSLTAIYFRTEDNGERIICIVFGFFSLVMAMGVLIIRDDTLDFGLEVGYRNFSDGAIAFLQQQGIDSHGPATFLSFRICLAILAGFVGCFLTFPGLRLAKMHVDAMKYATERPFLKLLLNLNIIFPLLITLMWVKPVMYSVLVQQRQDGSYLLEPQAFEAVRIITLLVFCIMRLFLIWPHLQAHLNLAIERVEAMKKEAGRISSIALQKMVTRVYYYLCVVALQYTAPLIMLLFLTLLLKTMGEINIAQPFDINLPVLKNISHVKSAQNKDALSQTAAQFSLTISSLRHVFTPLAFKGFLSFFCWWINTVWFATTIFGLAYHQYFAD